MRHCAKPITAHPRGDSFKNDIIHASHSGMKHRPDSTFGTVNDDLLASSAILARLINLVTVFEGLLFNCVRLMCRHAIVPMASSIYRSSIGNGHLSRLDLSLYPPGSCDLFEISTVCRARYPDLSEIS